ncbi:MAG: SDR family oxidoreductase [Acidimicrobiia bacterium]|nr:MAG: SDR family oxidoreductase [Acidimicrobiia bacterium]
MSSDLTDRVAVVTGGAAGIGLAISSILSENGATVVIADVDETAASGAVDELRAAGRSASSSRCDVTVESDVQATFEEVAERYGRLDILVNNAVAMSSVRIESMTLDEWNMDIGVPLTGAFLCTKYALEPMKERRSGAILNITSVNAFAFFGHDAYSAAKAGIVSLTKSVAVRNGPFGIRCNAIAPGTVLTEKWDTRVHANPELPDRLRAWYPLGRLGQPSDIANAAHFLVSDAAQWITGSVLTVDGGLLAGYPLMAAEYDG